jgi:putative tricarboxylic transport membrane protein
VNSSSAIPLNTGKAQLRLFLLLSAVLSCVATLASAQPTAWKPNKPVEIIVGVSPGGGIDRVARTLQKILQERRLIDVAASVVNKPGGGSTIALSYLNQHAGDAHYFEISSTSLLTNQITGKTTLSHRDFTPIVMLSGEYIGFAVKADSPLKTGRDLLDLLKTQADSLPIGIATTAGNTNHIAAGIVAKAAGGDVKKLRVVVFNSGGESMTAALGGHVGLVATPSANLVAHMQAGRLRVLAVAAPQRIAGPLAAVPTWRELGVNAVVTNWRPVIGPKGLSAAQVAYWEGVFARVTATDEWKSSVESSGGVMQHMSSRELANYFDAQYAEFKVILSDLGLAR